MKSSNQAQITLSLNSNENCLFIDLSYYVFYRYYAYFQWYEKAKSIKINEDNMKEITSDEEVQKHFKELVIKKIEEIKKKNKIKDNVFILKDCERKTIWRNDEIEDYKGGRIQKNFVGSFYGMGIKEIINNKSYQHISYNCLEADDLAYLSVRELVDIKEYKGKILIITNDNDYIQLLKYSSNIELMNLQKHDISNRNKFDSIDIFLQMKILNGDESDNINSIFVIDDEKIKKIYNVKEKKEVRLTKALILDIASNKASFDDYIKNNKKQPELYTNYLRNQKLIDFEFIPEVYKGLVEYKVI